MSRRPTHRYLDPLDAVWLVAAERIGLRIDRSGEVYAATDGRGRLTLGARETLDPDDCIAQMVFHELCHSLVEGPDAFARPDWGLDNESARDLDREHACLRTQAALAGPHGLRAILAPTTEHRAFYDAFPADALGGDDRAAGLARQAVSRAAGPPWAPHLERALLATATIAGAVDEAGGSAVPGALPALWSLYRR